MWGVQTSSPTWLLTSLPSLLGKSVMIGSFGTMLGARHKSVHNEPLWNLIKHYHPQYPGPNNYNIYKGALFKYISRTILLDELATERGPIYYIAALYNV